MPQQRKLKILNLYFNNQFKTISKLLMNLKLGVQYLNNEIIIINLINYSLLKLQRIILME